MKADHLAVEPNKFEPEIGHPGFDRDAAAAVSRQDFRAIIFRLPLESLEAGHGDYARSFSQFLGRGQRMLEFAAAREKNQLKLRRLALRDIAAARHAFAAKRGVDLIQHWNCLSRQGEQRGSVDALRRGCERSRSFFRISRADHVELRNHAEAADRLDRFVSWS